MSDYTKMLELIVKSADSRRAEDIEIFDISKISSLADYFIVCTGSSDTNVRAISDSIESELKDKLNTVPRHVEGYREADWILLDYGDVLIHIFRGETRRFYSVERLWNDAAPSVDASQFLPQKTVSNQ